MVAHPHILLGIGAAAGVILFLVLSFVPIPQVAGWNVSVSVTSQEVSYLVQNYFSITSVSGSTTGPSTIIDWSAWLSTAPFAAEATFTMTVCVDGSHCVSKSRSEWFPTVPFLNGNTFQAQDSFTIGNVPAGQQSISVSLTQNGEQVASGSGSMCVGGGC